MTVTCTRAYHCQAVTVTAAINEGVTVILHARLGLHGNASARRVLRAISPAKRVGFSGRIADQILHAALFSGAA
jgi:hypothetical protein